MQRRKLVHRYAWAVPSNDAIEFIAKLFPAPELILSIASGTGYWESLLIQAGCNVIATDIDPPRRTYCKVYKMSSEEAAQKINASVLFTCWPPYSDTVAFDAIKFFPGKHIIYVGEGRHGCTGGDELHELLSTRWKLRDVFPIPQYKGLNDDLVIYER
jgi:hypothetical protein